MDGLKELEAESIYIFRETASSFENPVILYSIGKDSSVLLRLALKAFYPSRPPFKFLHIDTTWKFKEMISFRDQTFSELGLDLITHTNEYALRQGMNPISFGSSVYTTVMKTDALRQALNRHKFDAAVGGARRDEEKSRAKERIFSHRAPGHRWDPRTQRPELWRLYNSKLGPDETMRVFPLSNWTELDVWRYIQTENIPIVPLYFAAPRPVVERNGMLIMVDDERMPLLENEKPTQREVRFRSLGCYPLSAAVPSNARSVPDILEELTSSRQSERQGRVIDHDETSSMEKKKREGYF